MAGFEVIDTYSKRSRIWREVIDWRVVGSRMWWCRDAILGARIVR